MIIIILIIHLLDECNLLPNHSKLLLYLVEYILIYRCLDLLQTELNFKEIVSKWTLEITTKGKPFSIKIIIKF